MVEGFDVCETTVAEIHDAIADGELTCEALVDTYLRRIEAYDRSGPELNGVVTVNDAAINRAVALDRQFAEDGFVGPLHGVPILVKDQALTADLRTTFGSVAFADYVPETTATVVERLRAAGAIVVAKTNLPDWAAGFVGFSSVAGQTKNPYALDRDSGGSSAGTGAGVAANLGAIGVGEDTGGSIRVPASCCNLYGLRPTTGLVSRAGFSPLVERQDTPGPMARTVADLALAFDAIAGFDPDDRATAVADAPDSYASTLDADALDGARIGVLRERVGDEGSGREAVAGVVEEAIDAMRETGAEIVDPVSLPDLETRLAETSLYELQAKRDIDSFLESLPNGPVDSVGELHERGDYHEGLALFETIADAPDDPTGDPAYWERVANQAAFREDVAYCHADHDLDAIVYPTIQVPPVEHERRREGDLERSAFPVNTVIASQSSCPAISMPGGFSDDGLPVGVELLGRPFSESRLLSLAYAYERATDVRQPPETSPALTE